MQSAERTLRVVTLGRFSIAVGDSEVKIAWPDETARVLFCSLLSPLDESLSWERSCRSLWGLPATHHSKIRATALLNRLQTSFAVQLGCDPFIVTHEGAALNKGIINIDAHHFHSNVVTGLRLLALGNRSAASQLLEQALAIYDAPFLPGVPGRIVAATRDELDNLYRMVAGYKGVEELRS